MDSAPVPNAAFAGTACFQCFTPSNTLKRCSSCQIVRYCTQECAVKDWKDHKSFCLSMKAIRSTLTPPTSLSSTTSNDAELSKRRTIQQKVYLTEEELLETALKRQPTMLESKLLWRENRCAVCCDREYDVERRKEGAKGWRVCKGCRVVGFCGKEHEEFGRKGHLEVKDAEGRTQCEAVQLSNEIDEFNLRNHLASSASASPSPPSLWVPQRILSTTQPLSSSWSSYLSSVSSQLPSPTPPLAEIHGVFLEALSPVLTILSTLQRLSYDLTSPKLTLYLLDESLETCSNWIPCLEELQHQLPSLQHLELITISPLPSSSDPSKSTQSSSITKLPICPICSKAGKSRAITHLPSLPSTLASNSLSISLNTSIALSLDPASNPTTFWSTTLRSLKGNLLLTSQTKEESVDAMSAIRGSGEKCEVKWETERNVWKGGRGSVEGWWGLRDGQDEAEGEGIVYKNGWASVVRMGQAK